MQISSFQRRLFIAICLFTVLGGILWGSDPLGRWLWQHKQLELASLFSPHDAALQFEIGNYYFESAHYDIQKAEKYFRRTLAANDRFPGAHYQLSRVYFINNDLNAALKEINTEIEIRPDFQRSHYIRGLVYGYMGQLEPAVRDFEAFLVYSPKSWAGHNDLAWIYFQLGQYDQALATAQAGLDANPDNVWLLNSKGVALLNLNRKQEARVAFERALEIASSMSASNWGAAYPGNNPSVYTQGLAAMRRSIQENLILINDSVVE